MPIMCLCRASRDVAPGGLIVCGHMYNRMKTVVLKSHHPLDVLYIHNAPTSIGVLR